MKRIRSLVVERKRIQPVHLLCLPRVEPVATFASAHLEAVVGDFVHQILYELLLHLGSDSVEVLGLLGCSWLLCHVFRDIKQQPDKISEHSVLTTVKPGQDVVQRLISQGKNIKI